MKIQFEEAIFTLPFMENRYDTHKVVADLYHRGNIHVRDYIFDIRGVTDELFACTLRAEKIPGHFNPTQLSMTLTKGERISGVITLNAVKRRSIKTGDKRVIKETRPDDINSFVTERLKKNGFSDIEITKSKVSSIKSTKGKHSQRISLCRAYFTATVENESLVSKAFLEGVGRNKAYGCGLLFIADKTS